MILISIIHKLINENINYCKEEEYNTELNLIIKELNKGKILIGNNKNLIELNLYQKTYDYNIVKILNKEILDINELNDQRVIVITEYKIFVLSKEKEK